MKPHEAIAKAQFLKKQRKAWQKCYFDFDRKMPKEYTPFAFNKAWGFSRSPVWLEEERKARAKEPDPQIITHAITISVLSPTGKEYSYKWYLPTKKRLGLEDFGRCVRMFEDKHLLYLEKNSVLGLLADKIYKESDLHLGDNGYLRKIRETSCDNPHEKTNTLEKS